MTMCQVAYAFSTKHLVDYECLTYVKYVSHTSFFSQYSPLQAVINHSWFSAINRFTGKPVGVHRIGKRQFRKRAGGIKDATEAVVRATPVTLGTGMA